MKYLITNADDYGYRPDISQAIVQAHQQGILTSTTVLINFVSQADVTLALQSPNLGLGLHLNITSGEPLTEKWKKKYGNFSRPHRNQPAQFDQEEWIPVFDKYKTTDVLEEYEAQLKKFVTLFGKKPTHLDSHHYHSNFSITFPAFCEMAKKHQLPVRQPVIWDLARNQHPMGNIINQPELVQKLIEQKIRTTDFFSVKYLNRYNDYMNILEKELEKVEDGQSIEISFHPGFEEEWRHKDLEILEDEKVRDLIEKKGFTLLNFIQNDFSDLAGSLSSPIKLTNKQLHESRSEFSQSWPENN